MNIPPTMHEFINSHIFYILYRSDLGPLLKRRSKLDVDIGPRWSNSITGPRKLGPTNSMS